MRRAWIAMVVALAAGSLAQDDCLLPDGTECPTLPVTVNYPDPDDCSSFYCCSPADHCAARTKCQHDYLFSLEQGACIDPDQVDCGSRPCNDPVHCGGPVSSTTMATTTTGMTTTTTSCGNQKNCVNVTDGWYAEPGNCRGYWHCLGGMATRYNCEDNLRFNPVNIWCDYPANVQCGDRPVCDDCDQNCVIHPDTCFPDDHFLDCTGKPDGYYGDQYNCRRYWHCLSGQALVNWCANDYLYNPVNNWCDYPSNVQCDGRPVCDDCDENCWTHPKIGQ